MYASILRDQCDPDDGALMGTSPYLMAYCGTGIRISVMALDATTAGNHTRFINHSYNPNVKTAHLYADDRWFAAMFAIAPIKAGEELFINYGEGYWDKRGKPVERRPRTWIPKSLTARLRKLFGIS